MPLKTVPRRPPPSPLRLHTGPTPPRNVPKHNLPSLPRPTFYPAKAGFTDLPVGNWGLGLLNLSVEDLALPPTPTTRRSIESIRSSSSLSSSPKSQRVLGPWERSRNLSETSLNIDSLIRAPKRAAVSVNATW